MGIGLDSKTLTLVNETMESVTGLDEPGHWLSVELECRKLLSLHYVDLGPLLEELRTLGTPKCASFIKKLEKAEKRIQENAGVPEEEPPTAMADGHAFDDDGLDPDLPNLPPDDPSWLKYVGGMETGQAAALSSNAKRCSSPGNLLRDSYPENSPTPEKKKCIYAAHSLSEVSSVKDKFKSDGAASLTEASYHKALMEFDGGRPLDCIPLAYYTKGGEKLKLSLQSTPENRRKAVDNILAAVITDNAVGAQVVMEKINTLIDSDKPADFDRCSKLLDLKFRFENQILRAIEVQQKISRLPGINVSNAKQVNIGAVQQVNQNESKNEKAEAINVDRISEV